MNVSGIRRNIKNIAHNYTDAQVKVREATSNDPWGPTSLLMSEISDLTYNVVAFSEIMQMIWKRLNDHGKNYRHVYKALVLLDYLVKAGNEKVAQQCKENIFAIHTLRDFQHYEEGKDQGINVREKAKQLEALLKDDERLKNERVKALKARERFAQQTTGFGIGSDSNFTGSRSDSFGSDPGVRSRPAAAPSDLDLARPQTAGEEELQLQLALAMSREEAEKEEERRRSDDVRLALAVAQSQEDNGDGTTVDRRTDGRQQQQQTHLLDLLDVNVSSGATAGWVDPWGTPAHPSEPPAPVMPPRPKAKTDFMTPGSIPQSDAWGMQAVASPAPSSVQADPWSPSSAAANPAVASKVTSNSSLNQQPNDPWIPTPSKTGGVADPWSPQPPIRTAASSHDPWSPASSGLGSGTALSSDIDGFDLLTTRGQTASPLGSRDTSSANGSSSPFDLSAMEGAMSPSTNSTGARPKKSPESFLGPNSNLVNLENLVKFSHVPAKPSVVPAANPFALTGGSQPNPFQQPPAPRPSINELRHQQNFGVLGTTPSIQTAPQQPAGVWGSPVTSTPMPPMSSTAMPLTGGAMMMQNSGQSVGSPTFNPFLA